MASGIGRSVRSWCGRYGLGLGLGLGALAPALTAVVNVGAQEPEYVDASEQRRRQLLRDIPRDPTVLINVTSGDVPSSTDILNLGRRSREALERCLADNVDAQMRSYCAELLGALGDRRSLPALQTALDDWEDSVRSSVVLALSRIPDPSSFEALLKLYRRKDEQRGIRTQVLYTLGLLGSPAAVRVLREELQRRVSDEERNQHGDFRQTAFAGLWRSRHLMARTTLEGDVAGALGSDQEDLMYAAAEVAAELRAPRLVPALVKLVDHPNVEIRNKSVYALGLIGNPAATKALVAALPRVREARMLNNIAFALERLDKAAFHAAAAKLIAHKQAIIRLNAAFVLGDVQARDELPLLAKALEDPSDFVRTSAVVALGKLGAPEGAPLLEKLLQDSNPVIREEAVYALYALSGGKRADLVHGRLFASPFARSPAGTNVRQRAGLQLGRAGDPRVREFLLACYESERCRLRDVDAYLDQDHSPEVARRLLVAWASGHFELTEHLADAGLPSTLAVALGVQDAAAAARDRHTLERTFDLIGRIGSAAERPAIARHAGARDVRFRMHAEVALVRLGDASAAAKLLADLDGLPADWLPEAARLLGKIREPAARAVLAPGLAQRSRAADVDQALAAAAVLLTWDPDPGFFRFLDALAAPSVRERDLAEQYLARNRADELTWVMRRALAREGRDYTRDRLRRLLDDRG